MKDSCPRYAVRDPPDVDAVGRGIKQDGIVAVALGCFEKFKGNQNSCAGNDPSRRYRMPRPNMAAEIHSRSAPVFTCSGVPGDWNNRPNAARTTLRRALTSFRVMGIKQFSLCAENRRNGFARHHRRTRETLRDGSTATLRD